MTITFLHYWQLLLRHRRLLAAIVVLSATLAAALALVTLFTKPVYKSSARVIMLPSEAELAFTRGRVSTDRSAQLLTETRIEYLMSRGVAKAVLDEVRENGGQILNGTEEEEEGGALAAVGAAFGAVKGFVNRSYRVLNSGTYVEPEPEDKMIAALQRAIRVRNLPGSYVLEISAELPSPAAAAFVANALADAYLERVAADLEISADEVAAFLERETADTEARLTSVIEQEQALRSELSLQDLDEEMENLTALLESERRRLGEAEIRIEEIEAEIAALRSQLSGAPRGNVLERVSQELALREAELEALEAGLPRRRASVADLTRKRESLRERETPITEVTARREALELDLESLRTRSLQVNVSRSAALTKLRVIDPAEPPTYPDSPRVLDQTVVGAAVGVLLSLLLLILIDTFSIHVSTQADLLRIVGGRALGTIRPRLGEIAVGGRSLGSKGRSLFRTTGKEIERKLVAVNALEAPRILVSGYLDTADLADATATLALALAAAGERVVCRLPAGEAYHSAVVDRLAGDRLQFLGTEEPEPAGDRVFLEGLPPLSHSLRLHAIAEQSPAFLCLVPPGEVTDLELEDFSRRALDAGLSALGFVLIES